MIQKILTGAVALLVVVVMTLGWQLTITRTDLSTATSQRDAAQQDASNARQAQQEAEGQSRLWASRFDRLDATLTTLGTTQASNANRLTAQLNSLSQIQKTDGDTDATIQCLDLPVPVQLDSGLRDDPASANRGH